MMRELIMLIVAAVLADNYIWHKCYGVDGFFSLPSGIRSSLKLTSALAVTVGVSAALSYFVYNYILAPLHVEYLKTIVFVSLIAAVEWSLSLLCDRLPSRVFSDIKRYIPLSVTGCAALAVILENIESGRGFLQSVLFSVFTAIGILISMIVFSAVRERIKLSSPPSAFAGAPIELVAAGLAALAFSGFYGMMI